MTQDPQTNRSKPAPLRRSLNVRGQVQGVGFRPFVYRLANELRLAGFVGNDPQGAFVEIEGAPSAIDEFTRRLESDRPPLAVIADVAGADVPATGADEFVIRHSVAAGPQEANITPDTALCDDCRREMGDEGDRRYRYPFINCTHCGPRYSIIQAVPYDRPNTTMAAFTMCPACQNEYDDPTDRRFHAQPNACGVCGPRVWLTDADGDELEGDAITAAATMLRRKRIVAIKGLGGFHLACRADDDEAVQRLRSRKRRESKPLAIMVDSLQAAGACCVIDPAAAAALTDPARPIVLAPKRDNAAISPHVAPGTDMLGVMLPYTPLHVLLLAEAGVPLVMTSGNPTDEPLCSDNAEALGRLARIADAFLLHDRDIERRVDDSVVMAVGAPQPHVIPLRRARGYVPAPIRVPLAADAPVLAVGGELKSAVCILDGDRAVMSEHLGELPNAAAFRNFITTIEQFKRLVRVDPKIIAHDLHPAYAATRHAERLPGVCVGVQHHHAHIVGCMADNGLTGRVIGLACDGTGYGTDGTVWGAEVLVCDESSFERAGHLWYIGLLGGDAAAKQTWRPATGWLAESFGGDWRDEAAGLLGRVDAAPLDMAEAQLARRDRLVGASSLGRLFDAAAFLLGLCDRNRHEAEAAMAIEAAARRCEAAEAMEYEIVDDDGMLVMDARPMIRRMLRDMRDGRDPMQLARAFHETLADMLAACAIRTARRTGLSRVIMSGGCFANRLLLTGPTRRLAAAGLEPYAHRRVPCGDGGLALGQAVAAAAMVK